MSWGLLLRPTVLLSIALGLASLGLYVQRQQVHAARADRDLSELRANTLAEDLKSAKRANQAQANVIAEQQVAIDKWADIARVADEAGRAAANRSDARRVAADRARAAAVDALRTGTTPDCQRLLETDLDAVCAP